MQNEGVLKVAVSPRLRLAGSWAGNSSSRTFSRRDGDATDSSLAVTLCKTSGTLAAVFRRLLQMSFLCWVLFRRPTRQLRPLEMSAPATWQPGNDIVTGYVGYTGAGTLAVNSGSTLTSDACFLGYNSGSTGTVTVSGAGLGVGRHVAPASIRAARSITPTFTLAARATRRSKSPTGAQLAIPTTRASGTTAVRPARSPLTVGLTLGALGLYVGCGGSGTITVTNGGTLSGSGSIGFGSTGTVTVDGPGSTWHREHRDRWA